VGLGDQVLDSPVVGPACPAGQGDKVGGRPTGPGDRAHLCPGTHLTLHGQHRPGDSPPLVHLADDVVVGQLDVIEELLAELGTAVDLAERLNLYAWLVDFDGEPRQAPVLRDVPVSPGQAEAVIGVVRPTRPDL
jgi:hypothetical protein